MKGERIAYIRVSSIGQNPDRQLDGVEVDKTFIDKVSGKSMERPQLKAMLEYIREGDQLLVHSTDRLARNVRELLELLKKLTSKKISVEFVNQNLVFTGDDSPMSRFMLTMLAAVDELAVGNIAESQREGIALAKKRGVYKGRKKALNEQQVEDIKARISKGLKKTDIAREFGVCPETLYQSLREDRAKKAEIKVIQDVA